MNMKERMHGVARHLRKKHVMLLILIFCVAIFARSYRFGSVPAGLHQDEMTLSYDAWSLMTYGVERNGFHFPIILPAYGSGQSGTLAAYLSIPFLAVFGLNPIGTRMLNLVAGIASLAVFYLLVQRMRSRKTALIATAFMAIAPWHIMVSRWGLDCNLFPALFLFATYALLRAAENPRWLAWSFALFGLSLYSYGTSYVVVPLFLILATAYMAKRTSIPWKTWATSYGILFAIGLPLVIYVLINTFDLPSVETPFFSIPNLPSDPRYSAAIQWKWSDGSLALPHHLATLYRVLVPQFDTWIDNSIPRFGTIYIATSMITLIGLATAFVGKKESKKFSPTMLMFFWLISGLSLTLLLNPMIHRINIIFIPLIFFSALGMEFMSQAKYVGHVLIVVYTALFIGFLNAYFGYFAISVETKFAAGLIEAIQYASAETDGTICVTNNPGNAQSVMSNMAVLYGTKFDPRAFNETVDFFREDVLYREARSFGRYVFGIGSCTARNPDMYVVHKEEITSLNPIGITQKSFGDFRVVIPTR